MALRNKRGWIKILEAFIAIMIIVGFLLYNYSKQIPQDNSDYIDYQQIKILEGINSNSSLRESVFKNDIVPLNFYISNILPNNLNFEIKICPINNEINCKKSVYHDKDIFVKDRIFAANLTAFTPLKLRLFVWER